MKTSKLSVLLVAALVTISAWAVEVYLYPTDTRIQIVGSNVVYTTSFPTQPGRIYAIEVQHSDTLDSTNWVNVTGSVAGTGGTVTWSYTNEGAATLPHQYYRLRVRYTFP